VVGFKRDDDARGFLLCRIEVKTAELVTAFGPAGEGGESEKGYDNAFGFVSDSGRGFNVYDRYGRYRIGGGGGEELEDFIAFIEAAVGHPINPVSLDPDAEAALARAHAAIGAMSTEDV
jgi:hypothetical protein